MRAQMGALLLEEKKKPSNTSETPAAFPATFSPGRHAGLFCPRINPPSMPATTTARLVNSPPQSRLTALSSDG